jgi:hypothetical protein
VVNTPASYSGGPGFKHRPGNRLSRLRYFVVFSGIPGKCRDLKIGTRQLPSSFFSVLHSPVTLSFDTL